MGGDREAVLAAGLGADPRLGVLARPATIGRHPLDLHVGRCVHDEDGDTSLGDLIAQESSPGPDLTVLDTESRDRLNTLVGLLDERSADIVRSRYGLTDGRQHKLADIGARHGISAERVRQLEREAIAKLRRLADPDLAA